MIVQTTSSLRNKGGHGLKLKVSLFSLLLSTWQAVGICWKKVPVNGSVWPRLILGPKEKGPESRYHKIAKAMITAGKALSAISTSARIDEQPKEAARMLKFGELQLEITPDNANIGAVIGVVFGILSFEIANGIENIPESSLQYANDNALLLAKSLRGALLALFYCSTVLSAFTTVGLVLLGIQLRSKKD
ncbi:hypothetical protein Ahy_A09g043980 isoform D [Arachis hypogaea]|uniref:Uncharacterized protein n=1 Tax=Arachis hypogaea TaxID=3818 RepID=A0A445BJE4_ARAHY|nr:hypothetical protein Ahy_A09g043980 isoform D [Arachis hypogaea]